MARRRRAEVARPARRSEPVRAAYERAPGTALLVCARPGCGASYLDDLPGRAAHKTVFGHQPKAPKEEP
jgi:hypothetical protein